MDTLTTLRITNLFSATTPQTRPAKRPVTAPFKEPNMAVVKQEAGLGLREQLCCCGPLTLVIRLRYDHRASLKSYFSILKNDLRQEALRARSFLLTCQCWRSVALAAALLHAVDSAKWVSGDIRVAGCDLLSDAHCTSATSA